MDDASYRALPLLPLVQVAWADGLVQDAERDLILQVAEDRFALGDEGTRVLRNWLSNPPSPQYAHRGKKVLVAICDHTGYNALSRDALPDVVAFSKQVARAAGGFFGFGAIDSSEAAAIDRIAQVLGIDVGGPWTSADQETFVPHDADIHSDGPQVEVQFHPGPLSTHQSRGTLIEHHEHQGEQSCPVTTEGLVIGRARNSTVQISYDAQVSRTHCRLFGLNNRFYVADLGSTCGTWVNGERIVERRLFGGETIHVGSATFFFQLSPI